MNYFPFIRWFFQTPFTGSGIAGRLMMLAVILLAALVTYRSHTAKKTKTAVFLLCFALWLAAELLYHFGKMGAQMAAALIGVPTLLIWAGMALGVLGRLLFKRAEKT